MTKLNWESIENTVNNELEPKTVVSKRAILNKLFAKFSSKKKVVKKKQKLPMHGITLSIILQIILFFIFFAKSEQKIEYVDVIWSKSIIKIGETIKVEHLQIKAVEKSVANLFISAQKVDKLINRALVTNFQANKPIPISLVQKIKGNSETENVPEGMRPFVFEVNAKNLSLSLQKYDKIDILGHLNIQNKGKYTITLLKAVQISEIDNYDDTLRLTIYLSQYNFGYMRWASENGIFEVLPVNPNEQNNKKAINMTANQFVEDPRVKSQINCDSWQIEYGVEQENKGENNCQNYNLNDVNNTEQANIKG